MSMRFDATLKDLVQSFLPDYEAQMGLSDFAPLTPLNVDLSTVSAATDIALGNGDPPDRIVDINFQSGPDEDLAARVLLYNALLHHRFGVPVHSVMVLLRPVANHLRLSGKLRYEGRPRKGRMHFTYEVIRLWEKPVKRFLTGGIGTLPLAPLCRLPGPPEEGLKAVVGRIAERLEREASPADRAMLFTAAYILTGLRVPKKTARSLFEGVKAMQESSTYQAILEEGREQGQARGQILALQKTLLRLGRHRFGTPSDVVQAAINGISDVPRLERLTERLLLVATWQELLEVE